MASQPAKVWKPDRFARCFIGGGAPSSQYTVILLNVPIPDREGFMRVWNGAQERVCADGGVNRLRDFFLGSTEQLITMPPNLVCGDFDSARSEALEFFGVRGAEIVRDDDQDSTDLMKALAQVSRRHHESQEESVDVLLIGSLGGRVDQALSQLHQLYLSSREEATGIGDVYLMTASSIVMLMEKGANRVHAPVSKAFFTKYAGIVPLAGPATLTTHGFEWNLDQEEVEFGRFISTSNHIVEDILEIETTQPVILTLEIEMRGL